MLSGSEVRPQGAQPLPRVLEPAACNLDPPGIFRKWAECGAIRLGRRTRWKWLTPFKFVGQYGPKTDDFRCRWYVAQLAQAILLIGLPARLVALSLIWCSLYLPDQASTAHLLTRA